MLLIWTLIFLQLNLLFALLSGTVPCQSILVFPHNKNKVRTLLAVFNVTEQHEAVPRFKGKCNYSCRSLPALDIKRLRCRSVFRFYQIPNGI